MTDENHFWHSATPRLRRLVAQWIDGQIDAAELASLQAILFESKSARLYYLAETDLVASLTWMVRKDRNPSRDHEPPQPARPWCQFREGFNRDYQT